MNEREMFEKIKRYQPEIKNINYVKNNIIINSRELKNDTLFENILLGVFFIVVFVLLAGSYVISLDPGINIYNAVRINLLIPTMIFSATLSCAGLIVYFLIIKITGSKEV